MIRLRSFLRFLYDFVIGDDWRIAAVVVVALVVTAAAANATRTVWWILPVAVAATLGGSVWSVARRR